MMIFQALLILTMIIGAVAASWFKDLLNVVIACAAVSLIASVLFYLLQAPDVAMAEAAIGAGLTTAIFVLAIRKTGRYEE
jgi:multicomponent Na+:H+ antiporter subunit A